jgi:hypothetical protein
MKRGPGKLIVVAVAVLTLLLPGTLSARHWRGVELILACQDGRLVRGELIAVKPDALVLLSADAKDESVALADIKTIRILKRPKVWQGLVLGFLAGAVGGAIWGGSTASEEWGVAGGAFLGGLAFGPPAGLVGLAAGMGAGLDDEIDLAGLPATEMDQILARLSRQAREPGAYVPRLGAPTAGGPGIARASSRYERRRFKLTWMPGHRVWGQAYSFREEAVTFRFTEALPPEEAGPYASPGYAGGDRPRSSLGRMTLAYSWTRQLAAEIELYVPRRLADFRTDELRFTSTLDGLTYYSYFGGVEDMSLTSLLVGFSFRPAPPAFLFPHSVELGVAAGPAWISWSLHDYNWTDSRRIMTWTARGRVSYDFHFNPMLSMGAFAEYRWIPATIPAYTRNELLEFHESSYPGGTLTRTTEVVFPPRTVALGGFALGLRFGVNF